MSITEEMKTQIDNIETRIEIIEQTLVATTEWMSNIVNKLAEIDRLDILEEDDEK